MIAVERLNLGCVGIGWRHDAVSMVRQSSRPDLSNVARKNFADWMIGVIGHLHSQPVVSIQPAKKERKRLLNLCGLHGLRAFREIATEPKAKAIR